VAQTSQANPREARPAGKRQRLLSELRARILDGQYRPGQRIPTRVELLEQFNVSTLTLQKALDRLIEEGFLVARGRSGTFVTEAPPHLAHFALVFPHRDRPASPWPRFWAALASEAERMTSAGDRRIDVFYSMYGRRDTAEYRALRQAVRSQTLAGILFCYRPRELLDSSVLRDHRVPSWSIGGVDHPSIGEVTINSTSFMDKALDHLAQRRRRKIAVITATSVYTSAGEIQRLRRGLEQRGMTMHSRWFQALDPARPRWAHPCVELLMHAGQADRPDGLIIANDNLVEAASGGLVAAGVGVPDDVEVAAHCNFPWPTPSVLPLQRLGFDARDVLRGFLGLAEASRASGGPPGSCSIEAKFESEAGDVAAPCTPSDGSAAPPNRKAALP